MGSDVGFYGHGDFNSQLGPEYKPTPLQARPSTSLEGTVFPLLVNSKVKQFLGQETRKIAEGTIENRY